MTTRRLGFLFAFALLIIWFAGDTPRKAEAFTLLPYRFQIEELPITLDVSSLRSDWRDDVEYAAGQWNRLGTQFYFIVSATTPSTPNGVVTVDDTNSELPGACKGSEGCYGPTAYWSSTTPARAKLLLHSGRIESTQEVRAVLVHELGHALGLDHNSWQACVVLVFRSVMGCGIGSNFYQTPFPDDVDGAEALWGESSEFSRALTPIVSSPVNGALISGLRPTLAWNLIHTDGEGLLQPILQMSTSADMTNPFLRFQGYPSGTETIQTEFDLVPGATYYWRVKAINLNGPSPWSTVRSFTIDPSLPPGGQPPDPPPVPQDQSAPIVDYELSALANAFGWHNEAVTIQWGFSDPESGIGSSEGCQPTTVANETAGETLTCVVTNGEGLVTVASITVRIDFTAPNTTHSLNPPTPNGKRNWYISDVTVTLDQSDPLLSNGDQPSGVQVTRYRVNDGAWTDYTGSFAVSHESLDNKVEYYSIDRADNQQTTQEFHFKLDKTPPEITIDSGETDDIIWDQAHLERGILSNDPVLNIDCNATDNLALYEVRAENAGTGAVLDSENIEQNPPLTQYDCQLQIPLTPGINTIDIIAEDCAGWEDAVRIQVVYVVPGQFDPRTKGFWWEAVKTKKYSNAQISTFLSYINVASDVWGNDATRNRYGPLTLSNYKALLGVPDSANMEQKMQAQLLADWLNMVSGRLAVKRPVNVSPIANYGLVMDGIGGNPLTYAYRVTLEIEEKVQPAPASTAVNTVAKNLAEGINMRTIILP